jgi:cell division protein FtsB
MREYQHKHMVRTLVYSKFTILVLFLLVVLLLRSIMELNTKRKDVVKLRNDSQKERSELENKVMQAEARAEFIATPRGFEEYVRTTYPVVKDGEGVIVIYDDNKSAVSEVRNKMTYFEQFMIWWRNFFKQK